MANTVASMLSRKKTGPISVSKDTSILDALHIMAEHNIGSVVVVENGEYRGILTERDYSRKVILRGKNSGETKVQDIMSTNLPVVKSSDSVDHCMQLMTAQNVRYMPVFEGDKLVGIISMSDVVKETILSQKDTITALESYIHNV